MAVASALADLSKAGKQCAFGIFVRHASVFKNLNELVE